MKKDNQIVLNALTKPSFARARKSGTIAMTSSKSTSIRSTRISENERSRKGLCRFCST